MKQYIFIAAMLLAFVSCSTQKKSVSSLPLYDERPVNEIPTIERPAWPNYDTQNENSFAVFSHIYEPPVRQGLPLMGSQGDGSNATWRLRRCKDATYLTYDYVIPQDWFFFRFTTGSCLIDADTGDRYLLREVEHLPMDQCFWIHGMTGRTIRLVLIYAPLPESVKRICVYEAEGEPRQWMDGDAWLSEPNDVNTLRQDIVWSESRAGRIHTDTGGRIIR